MTDEAEEVQGESPEQQEERKGSFIDPKAEAADARINDLRAALQERERRVEGILTTMSEELGLAPQQEQVMMSRLDWMMDVLVGPPSSEARLAAEVDWLDRFGDILDGTLQHAREVVEQRAQRTPPLLVPQGSEKKLHLPGRG